MSEVVVVGSGPAGAAAALHLARRGHAVTVLERSAFPRVKVCGDYLSAGAMARIRALRLPVDILADAQPIDEIALHAFGAMLRLPLGEPAACSLPRRLLDQRLATAAHSEGARFVRGVFLAAHEEPHRILVTFRDPHAREHTIAASALVGADGAWSSVARRTGMARCRPPAGPWAIGGELAAGAGGVGTTLDMYVGADGYYARNPLPGSSLNSMLVIPRPVTADRAEDLVARITCGRRRFEAERIARKVAIGPLRWRARRVARGRIVLAGDAAALLDPFTGQGVATALETAQLAAHAAAALACGRQPRAVAAWYERRWREAVEPRRDLTALIRALVGFSVLRRRALRAGFDPAGVVRILLGAVSGMRPPREALTVRTLWSLLVA